MTMAANLTEAASLSYVQVSLTWTALTLKTKYAAYLATASPILSDGSPNDRTVGNWLVLIAALSTEMSSTTSVVSEAQFDTAVEYLYRICLAGAQADAQGRITTAQRIALLAAWNTNFGT